MGYVKQFRKNFRKRVPKYARKTYKAAKTMFRLARDVAAIQTSLNTERKYWDRASLITSTVNSITPLMLAQPWDGLSKSLDSQGRLGDTIKALYTTFRARFDFAPSGVTDAQTAVVRILVIMDTEPRLATGLGVTALRDAVLQLTSTGPLQVTSPYRVALGSSGAAGGYVGQRYKVLRDFRFTLDNVAQKQKMIKINLNHMKNKTRGQRVKYADIDANDWPCDNRLYIIAVTDHPTANEIIIDGDYSRLCYVDN